MKLIKLILLCLCFSFSVVAQNDTTKYFGSVDYGWKYERLKVRKAFIMPSDTVLNKLGTAVKGSNIYVGNGVYWAAINSSGLTTTADIFTPKIAFKGMAETIYAGYESDYYVSNDTVFQWYTNYHDTIHPAQLRYSVNHGTSWSSPVSTNLKGLFPTVEYYNGAFYAMVVEDFPFFHSYLYKSTNKTNFVIQNGGSPVVTASTTSSDYRYHLLNPGFTIIRDTIYLLQECAAELDSGYYGTSLFTGFAKAPLSAPTFTLSTSPVFKGANSDVFYIPEANALLSCYADNTGVFPDYTAPINIKYAVASLANNLKDSLSWVTYINPINNDTLGNHASDPAIAFFNNFDSSLMYYVKDQISGWQAYMPHIRSAFDLYNSVVYRTPVSVSNSSLPIAGTGTINYIPKWISAGSQSNSRIFDNGTSVGINTASPTATLDVNGTLRANGVISTTASLQLPTTGVITFGTAYNTGSLSINNGASTLATLNAGIFNFNGPQIGVIDGTYTHPAIVFASGINSGIYSPAADAFAFTSSNVVKLLIDATGKVGIGTTSPTSKLQVVGLPVYANNAAAITGGLTAGAFYRTGGDPDPVCVVH